MHHVELLPTLSALDAIILCPQAGRVSFTPSGGVKNKIPKA